MFCDSAFVLCPVLLRRRTSVLLFHSQVPDVFSIWPAAGVAVAAVLVWGIQIAPAIAFAAFLVNFLSPVPTLASSAIGLGNASSAIVAGYLLKRSSDFEISLPRLRDVVKLVTVGAVLATAVAASVGVTALMLVHTKAWAGYGSAWRIWWLGDAMGVLVIAPLLLTGQDLLHRLPGLACARSLFAVSHDPGHVGWIFSS